MSPPTKQLPWYRQFWPWFLIALPGTVVVAALYTLFLANRYSDDLVIDDYYKEGLAINRQLDRQHTAETLGITATLKLDNQQLDITVTGQIAAPQLRLMLSHPMEASRDLTVPVKRTSPGHYRVQLPQPLPGRWHWTLDAGQGSPWRIDGEQDF